MAPTCHLCKIGNGGIMKRFSTIFMAILCIALTGVGGYAVFAAISTTMTAKNVISFTASDDIFFRATVNVVYAIDNSEIVSDVVDHSGIVGKHNASKTAIAFNDGITFKKEKRTIWYNIVVENYSEFPISVRVYPPESVEPIVNELNITDAVVTPARVNGGEAPTTKFRLATTLASVKESFIFDNSFEVYIEKTNQT